jgi:hypothetical protein
MVTTHDMYSRLSAHSGGVSFEWFLGFGLSLLRDGVSFMGIYRATVEMYRLWMLHYAIEIYLRFFDAVVAQRRSDRGHLFLYFIERLWLEHSFALALNTHFCAYQATSNSILYL